LRGGGDLNALLGLADLQADVYTYRAAGDHHYVVGNVRFKTGSFRSDLIRTNRQRGDREIAVLVVVLNDVFVSF
jgi:hypothetical protein